MSARNDSIEDSPFGRLAREVHQAPELRRPLILGLEELLGSRVLTFFTSFFHPEAQIDDSDVEMVESLLNTERSGKPLILIINSPGGQALAAERLVSVCRAYSKGKFEVLVPHMAKSAATMVCFGANKIHMSGTAELGPVDPQIAYKTNPEDEDQSWISAEEYIRSYDKLIKLASAGKSAKIEPFLQQLARFDDRYVERLRSLQRLSADISVRLLKNGMLSNKTDNQIKKAIDIFLIQKRTSSHGRMITMNEARRCGLKIEEIDLDSQLWEKVWELYIRSNWVVTNRSKKLIETGKSAVSQ
jgi:hypothetical protein